MRHVLKALLVKHVKLVEIISIQHHIVPALRSNTLIMVLMPFVKIVSITANLAIKFHPIALYVTQENLDASTLQIKILIYQLVFVWTNILLYLMSKLVLLAIIAVPHATMKLLVLVVIY